MTPIRRRIARRLAKVEDLGVVWVAVPFTALATAVSDSWWPLAVWLVTAYGAQFDRGWNRRRRG